MQLLSSLLLLSAGTLLLLCPLLHDHGEGLFPRSAYLLLLLCVVMLLCLERICVAHEGPGVGIQLLLEASLGL